MSESTSENKSVSLKRIEIRPQQWLAELVETTMKEQKIKTVTEALHYLARELLVLRENPKMETVEYPECGWRIFNPRTNLYECLNPKPPVNLKHFSKDGLFPEVCVRCQNVKIVKKTTQTRQQNVKKTYRYQKRRKKPEENYSKWYDATQPYKGDTY